MSSRNFITVVWTSLLLAFGSMQVCRANDAGIHPAHLADADLPAVERLITAGADVNARHISGTSALHHLVTVSADMGSIGQRMRKGKIYFAGQWSATGHLRLAELLLASGAEVNLEDDLGQTPLHIAALTGHSDAARFLLANGAEVNVEDTAKRTPSDLAKWSATDEAIAELASATGQKVDARAIRVRVKIMLDLLRAYGAK